MGVGCRASYHTPKMRVTGRGVVLHVAGSVKEDTLGLPPAHHGPCSALTSRGFGFVVDDDVWYVDVGSTKG